jgi:hypothetical protein
MECPSYQSERGCLFRNLRETLQFGNDELIAFFFIIHKYFNQLISNTSPNCVRYYIRTECEIYETFEDT